MGGILAYSEIIVKNLIRHYEIHHSLPRYLEWYMGLRSPENIITLLCVVVVTLRIR